MQNENNNLQENKMIGKETPIRGKTFEVMVNGENGKIASVHNLLTGKTYKVIDDSCRLVFDKGIVDLSKVPMRLTGNNGGKLIFAGAASGVEISRVYSMSARRDYLDRELIIRNMTGGSLVLETVEDAALSFGEAFQSVHYHNDGMDGRGDVNEFTELAGEPTVYRGALNVFLRDNPGGLFVGIKYPYWRLVESNKKDQMELAYDVNYRLKSGETLELPAMFLGAYKNSGFVCRKDLHWHPPFLITQQEELDWAEVWAMRKVLRDYLPRYPGLASGYAVFVNCCWAYAWDGACAKDGAYAREMRGALTEKTAANYCDVLDRAKLSGCIDAMATAQVWVGWTGYCDPCSELEAVKPDAIFPHNPWIDRLVDHAQKISMKLFSWCESNLTCRPFRNDRPDWKVQPSHDPAKRLMQNCHANQEYEDWYYRLLCNVIDTCGLCGWAFDQHWIRRPMRCYDQTHGHQPGNCEFQQYRTATNLIHRLRERYPEGFFELYWGFKEAGSWAHRGLNSLENLYENGRCIPPGLCRGDDLRFQAWYNHNYRFLPTYMNIAHINFTLDANGNLYSILSALQASTHGQLSEFPEFKTGAEADRIFKDLRYWKEWATKHMEYLEDCVDLFGQPCRSGGIDGSAHIIGDRGYIFVFNPWPGEDKWGSIPINELIGIEKGGRFALDEISSGTAKRMGVCEIGDNFLFPIAAKTAILIELKPASETVSRVEPPAGIQVQTAFAK